VTSAPMTNVLGSTCAWGHEKDAKMLRAKWPYGGLGLLLHLSKRVMNATNTAHTTMVTQWLQTWL
jgi:hypothetical protein